MRLTQTLLGYLNRVFNKDPLAFRGLVIDYDGGMSWKVADGRLTTRVSGGAGEDLSLDLTQLTLAGLAAAIAGRTGYTVAFLDNERAGLSARVLLDGQGDLAQPNGGQLLGYTSLLWSLFDAIAAQLQRAREQVGQMLLQLSTTTASGIWLEELGRIYRVPKNPGEVDEEYGPRIIAETLRPTTNNVAMELAIQSYTGQAVEVTDLTIYRGVFPVYDGQITHNSEYTYATVGLPEYGLFDVKVTFDILNSANPAAFQSTVRALVERFRAGGTHMRALDLDTSGAAISDTFTSPPTDNVFSIKVVQALPNDARGGPEESAILLVNVGGALGSDGRAAPAEAADGVAVAPLKTQSGAIIQTEGGAPIQATLSDLFS